MSEKKQKHSPEPWRVLRDETYHDVIFIGSDGGPFVSGDVEELDAARIVQCVNACAGIEDPEGAIEQIKETLRAAYSACANPATLGTIYKTMMDLGMILDD